MGVEFRRSKPRDPTQKRRRKKRRRKGSPLSQQVYLKGLGGDVSEDDIRSALSAHGEIKRVFRRQLKGDDSGQLCDYAFVTFATDDEAAACVAAGTRKIASSNVTVEARRPRLSNDAGSA